MFRRTNYPPDSHLLRSETLLPTTCSWLPNTRKRRSWLLILAFAAPLAGCLASAPAQTSSSASQGRPFIPEKVTGGLCTTRVSPGYPASTKTQEPNTVVLRVVLSRSGALTPLYKVSGPPELEFPAMNSVRLWKCKPYANAAGPLDVLTEVHVNFVPGRPPGFITHGSE
jgi:hypothetical protein